MIINNNELKFAEKVILLDAAYINKVTTDLSKHFSQVIGRELPKADLPIFLECVAMDAAIQPGENVFAPGRAVAGAPTAAATEKFTENISLNKKRIILDLAVKMTALQKFLCMGKKRR